MIILKLKANLFLLLLLFAFCGEAQNDSTVAVTELNRFNEFYGYRVKMTVTEEGPIVSLPNEEIQMSLAELKRISPVIRKDLRFYIVRFIVAHEFAHQMQYYYFRDNPKFLNNDLASKTIIETQADILAGQILTMQSPELYAYMNTHPMLVKEILEELFRVAHSLGSRENTLGSHPSKRDRMLAIRLGLTQGFSYQYDQMVKSNPDHAIQQGLTLEMFTKQMDEQMRFVDIERDEGIMDWSYRQARKIVNDDRKIATNIVLTTPQNNRHVFHEDESYPYVDYDLTYQNIGNRSIEMEMEVFVALINREDPNSGEFYRKLNVEHYTFTLAPGESKTLNNKLCWLKNDGDETGILAMQAGEYPRIVYPGIHSFDAMYSCKYSDDVSNRVYQEDIASFGIAEGDLNLDFPIFFNALLNAHELNDKDLIQGIGELGEFMPNTVTHICALQLADDTETVAVIDSLGRIIAIELQFPNYYPSKSNVVEKYKKLVQQLNVELDEAQKNGGDFWMEYVNDEFIAYIECSLDEIKQEYSILFSIDFE